MQHARQIALALVLTLAAAPALPDSLQRLEAGEAIAVMPDGHIGRVMVTNPEVVVKFLKTAKRIPWCVMLLKGADGHIYLVNTAPHAPMVACEDMAPN